jgi:hypothetical protein
MDREYEKGDLIRKIEGADEGGKYLMEKGIQPIDEFGETRIIQL